MCHDNDDASAVAKINHCLVSVMLSFQDGEFSNLSIQQHLNTASHMPCPSHMAFAPTYGGDYFLVRLSDNCNPDARL